MADEEASAHASSAAPPEIVDTPGPLEGKEEHRLAYIHAMIAVAVDDSRHVALHVTFALGIVALIVSQFPLDRVLALPLGFRILLCIGITSLGLAALAYFGYVRELHRARMRMALCLPTIYAERVQEMWSGESGVWNTYGWRYKAGRLLLGLGLAAIACVIFAIYLRAPEARR